MPPLLPESAGDGESQGDCSDEHRQESHGACQDGTSGLGLRSVGLTSARALQILLLRALYCCAQKDYPRWEGPLAGALNGAELSIPSPKI